ncbi:MAG: hypothetical protein DRP78_04970, partial [Candidatus Omnitrophota bacterium]
TGAEITDGQIQSILKNLGFEICQTDNAGVFKVGVPDFRNDIDIPQDLIEEVLRIWGYHNVLTVMPRLRVNAEPAFSKIFYAKNKLRQIMLAQGVNEIITYAFLSKKALLKAKSFSPSYAVIQNPLSTEQEYMRCSLMPLFLKTINLNLNRKISQVNIFEIGKIYASCKQGFEETEVLAIALCGEIHNDWQEHRNVDFYNLKGIIETVLSRMGVKDFSFKRQPYDFYQPEQSAAIVSNEKNLGFCGKISQQVLSEFDISHPVFFAQIEIEKLLHSVNKEYKFISLSKYPVVTRDIAIIVKENVPSQTAVEIIKRTAGDLLASISLFDVFQGNPITAGFKSLAYSVAYQSKDRTLTDLEIIQLHNSVLKALTEQMDVKFR